jgi:hypothetical protein
LISVPSLHDKIVLDCRSSSRRTSESTIQHSQIEGVGLAFLVSQFRHLTYGLEELENKLPIILDVSASRGLKILRRGVYSLTFVVNSLNYSARHNP